MKKFLERKTEVTYKDIAIVTLIFIIGTVLLVLTGFCVEQEQNNTQIVSEQYRNDVVAYKETISDMRESYAQRSREIYRDGFIAGKKSALAGKPYQPKTLLSLPQEKRCLALLTYSETRGTLREDAMDIMWAGINRAEDPRRDAMFRGSVCGIAKAGAGVQFEGMSPYTKAVDNIVWGTDLDYIPYSARKEGVDKRAWEAIVKMTSDAMDGKLPKTTEANHFLQFQSLKGTVPSWVRDLKPVGVSANHVLFTDHDIVDGKMVRYTKEKPYRPKSNW